MRRPIRIHPTNRKLLEHEGRATVLLAATEHYGAVLNRPFDIDRYLEHHAACGLNFTRLFLLFRELQASVNPHSTCKPESQDYIAPYPRSGRGLACDLLPKYGLNEWNPEFLARLHRFLATAERLGIVVEVVLFSHQYGDAVWSLSPLHPANNTAGWGPIAWWDFETRRHEGLLAAQERYAEFIVRELNGYANIVYEACNEPGGSFPAAGAPGVQEVNEWLGHFIGLVRRTETGLPNRHLVFGQEAFAYRQPGEPPEPTDVHQHADASFDALDHDVVNMHPLSNMILRGNGHNLGRFMLGELRLRELRDYCLALSLEAKPFNLDEDNAASRFTDSFGWTIHRKRAWTTLLCGGHHDVIDFSVQCGLETGTEASRDGFRRPLGFLCRLVNGLDLESSRPLQDVLAGDPEDCVAVAFGDPKSRFLVYVADARERGYLEPPLGRLTPRVGIAAPPGRWRVQRLDPMTEAVAEAGELGSSGKPQSFDCEGFLDDLCLVLTREGG